MGIVRMAVVVGSYWDRLEELEKLIKESNCSAGYKVSDYLIIKNRIV